MFRWKRELDYLKRSCEAREAPTPPAAILEWFDLNRSEECTADDLAALRERIEVVAADFKMDDWRMHTDAYGWRFLLQPYLRDGRRYFLLCVERADKPSERDLKRRDKLVRYLGADPEEHYLMGTRTSEDPDVQDYWTWPAEAAS